MTIIQIAPQSNGAHANQTTANPLPEIPEGWAVVPEDLETPDTFPFVDITAGKITVDPDTQPVSVGEEGQLWVVTSMTPGAVPEPAPEPEPEPTAEEDLLAMAVDHEMRLTMLEMSMAEPVNS